MTLLELATYVCGKVRQSDDAALAACKGFLSKRAEMIWNEQLWKDSLLEAQTTLTSAGTSTLADSVWIPSRGTLLLPPDMDRILAVRTAERALLVEAREQYFKVDTDVLAQTGTPRGYHVLKPVVWEFETATTVYAVGATGNVRALLSADAVSTTVATAAATPTGAALGTALLVLSASNDATGTWGLQKQVQMVPAGATYADGGLYDSYVECTGFVVGQSYDLILGNAVYGLSSSKTAHGPHYIVADGTFTAQYTTYYLLARNVGQASTSSILTMDTLVSTSAASCPVRQRIRLQDMPEGDVTLRILFKQKFPGFSNDNDLVPVQTMDNALMAFAQADMLQRARQYGKAQVCQQEGATLLAQLVNIETVQQARRARLTPGEGYGDEFAQFNNPLVF